MSISEFLEARIAEDERQYEVCRELGWYPAEKYGLPALSYDRLIAECASKRAIVEWSNICFTDSEALHALAAVYKYHPDYQQEWTSE